jgi:alpha-glucosidase (family GH31 glycosyl hydrolase)
MHNESVASFEKINESFASKSSDEDEVKKESKRKCIIISCVIIALVAAILALILVLVLSGSRSSLKNGYNSYEVTSVDSQDWYYESILVRTEDTDIPVSFDNVTNPEFDNLRMRVSMMNDHTYRLRINPVKMVSDSNNGTYENIKRWEVPQSVITDLKDDYSMRLKWGGFQSSSKKPGIQLLSPSQSNINYFSTENRNFVFSDKYLEMGFLVDSTSIYGFGERHRHFELRPGNYTAWTDGRDNLNDQGTLGYNLYGDHPFVLVRLNDNTFVGIFFKNSNAKTLEYIRVGYGQSVLNFRAIGGILDFYTFIGDTPEDVIRAYHKLIGSPYFPPFWALGFHQGSLQYANIKNLTNVVDGYDNAKIPLESIWLDMKYMNNYQNFLVDKVNFPNLPLFSDKLHKKHQKVVTVIQAGLKADEAYSYYKQASSQGKLIKSTQNPGLHNGDLIGEGPMGKCAYIDFSHNNITEFWVNAMRGLYTETTFDAVWLDQNEIQSECTGECPSAFSQKRSSIDLPFDPTGNGEIENRTISLDAQHFYENEEDKALNIEYNVHSLYGTLQSKNTNRFWFDSTSLKDKRPFVVSRSTFAGAGKYTSHWLGPNNATWADMQLSISSIMGFSMYGIPLTGASICGYNGGLGADQELCARWFQLSAFYPFARNHYGVSDKDHELLPPQEAFNLNYPYNNTAKYAIEQRYSFLRYMYTRLFEISRLGGGTLIRPLFFEFPKDDNTYLGYEHSFMVGDALKITPQLRSKNDSEGLVVSYFPKNSRFISLNDFTSIILGGESGLNRTVKDSYNYTVVHMKEGTIIPYQNTTEQYYDRTYALINDKGLDVIIFPDMNGNAEGTLYIDKDGENEPSYELGAYEYYKLRYNNNTLKISKIDGISADGDLESGNHIIKGVYILGVERLDLNEPAACALSTNMEPKDVLLHYDAERKIVKMNVTNSNTLTFTDTAVIQFYPNVETAMNLCNPQYTVANVTTESKFTHNYIFRGRK